MVEEIRDRIVEQRKFGIETGTVSRAETLDQHFLLQLHRANKPV